MTAGAAPGVPAHPDPHPPRPELRAEAVGKRYSGVPALRGVSVAVPAGRVVGLVGHNGAGKSTLLRILAGETRPDAGTVQLDGGPVVFGSPADALRAGVATVYQELSLLPNLSVAQNVFLGRERRRAGLLRRADMRDEARRVAAGFALDIDVDRPLGDYSIATRQLLEIAVAAQRGARFLLLDEPTTSLEGGQVDRLLDRLRDLAGRGLGILLVDHKLDELYAVADHVVALVDGEVRVDGPIHEVGRDEVVRAITGDDRPEPAPDAPAASPVGPAAWPGGSPGGAPGAADRSLVVRHLRTPTLHDVSLEVQPGRVLGLYGLVGSGRTEFMRALVGVEPVRGGEVDLHGRPYVPRSPAAARRRGLVYLTEERKRDGIVPLLDAPLNTALPVLLRYRRAGLLDRSRLGADAATVLDRLQVRGERGGPVVRLSGGNQQKVLLARVLAQHPTVLLLDEPTRGVDIGVKAQIHAMVRDLAHRDGLTVVVASSEEEEILDLADDVAVFVRGRTVAPVREAGGLGLADLRALAWTGG
jgi:ribose transport system ATP-binding protein